MSISFRLDNKTILVTGASSGLGQSIALHAAEAGAKVLLCGRNETRLQQTAEKCGAKSVICPQDLCEVDALPKFVRGLAKEHGPLSGLVHSAGIEQLIPLRALQAKHLQNIFQINTIAGIMLLKGFAMRGVHTEYSSSILMSSVTGRVGKPALTGYSMSKGAIEQAVKSLALELQPSGIRVNAVAPAMIRTPMFDKFFMTLSDVEKENILADHPGGIGAPEDVAAAVIYLLSEASKFVTGTSLLVDGGYCAQ